MSKQITRTFDLSIYTASSTAVRLKIEDQFVPPADVVTKLATLHSEVITRILEIPELTGQLYCTSGYRCPELNTAVKGAKTSQHCKGEAADLEYYENGVEKNLKLNDAIIKAGIEWDQLIREYGTDDNPSWIHVSYRAGNNRNQTLVIK